MPKKKDDVNIKIDEMKFTDQKSFLASFMRQSLSNDQIDFDLVEEPFDVTKKKIVNAISSGVTSEYVKGKIFSDISLENIVHYTRKYTESIKELIDKGVMEKNIQTEHNERGTKEYQFFNLSNLEQRLIIDIKNIDKSDKKSFLKFKESDNDIIKRFAASITPDEMKKAFKELEDDLFPDVFIRAKDHDYEHKEETKEYVPESVLSNLANRKISDQKLVTGYKAKPTSDVFKADITEDSISKYAKSLKGMYDALKKRPWYVRWFSKSYTNQMTMLDQCKGALISRGISEKSINDFIKSDGKDKDLNKLIETNKESVKEINEASKNARDINISKQEEMNEKNFFKEQKSIAKAKETLAKVEDDFDLEYDLNNEVMESSDDLQSKLGEEFDEEFTKETLDAFDKSSDEIINEKNM